MKYSSSLSSSQSLVTGLGTTCGTLRLHSHLRRQGKIRAVVLVEKHWSAIDRADGPVTAVCQPEDSPSQLSLDGVEGVVCLQATHQRFPRLSGSDRFRLGETSGVGKEGGTTHILLVETLVQKKSDVGRE